ncbi:hypothetical protein [Orlajensenia leifsoniae]|uniref:Uncharacterized protein n=1 Tax=Orlajensenia leifsoniae TaxID=2561933 RepID=A0A4Y9R249_9MICO|nr:hypothetical protein [Leifsonia flava]TFV98771.1 hypothetical protein E4M00_04460 [Leifsonia flava]
MTPEGRLPKVDLNELQGQQPAKKLTAVERRHVENKIIGWVGAVFVAVSVIVAIFSVFAANRAADSTAEEIAAVNAARISDSRAECQFLVQDAMAQTTGLLGRWLNDDPDPEGPAADMVARDPLVEQAVMASLFHTASCISEPVVPESSDLGAALSNRVSDMYWAFIGIRVHQPIASTQEQNECIIKAVTSTAEVLGSINQFVTELRADDETIDEVTDEVLEEMDTPTPDFNGLKDRCVPPDEDN